MATTTISEDFNGPYNLGEPELKLIIANNVTGTGSGQATVHNTWHYTDCQIVVRGILTNSNAYNIETGGDKTGVTIETSGRLTGFAGILFDRTKNVGQNDGIIDVSNIGVKIEGTNAKFTNNGTISASYGFSIEADADNATIVNNGIIETSTMVAWVVADHVTFRFGTSSSIDIEGSAGVLVMAGDADQRVTITNAGTITAQAILQGVAGREDFTNTGSLNGNLFFAGGNDTFDTSEGSFTGTAYGGEGNDTFVLGSAAVNIVEFTGGGTDVVKSARTIALNAGTLASQEIENLTLLGKKKANGVGNDLDNQMTGNNGRNDLDGGIGEDTLSGGKGNDVLTGGTEADRFVFKTGFGMDTITDFTVGEDVVDIKGWKAVHSFKDLLKHADKHGADLWIVADDDILILEDVKEKHLDKADFLI